MVIEKSTDYATDILRDNPKISYFYMALEATGVREDMLLVDDPTWADELEELKTNNQQKYYYKSHTWQEVAWAPDTKKFGYTIFVEPDDVYDSKFQEKGD